MKNLFKKVSAILMAAIMVLAMASTAFADDGQATITVNGLDDHATISYVQIIEPDQTTETGWRFVDNGAAGAFKSVNGWSNLTDQQILWKLIASVADETTVLPANTVAATASEFQKAMEKVEEMLTYTDNSTKDIPVNKAGVYAIKATTTDTENYAYSPMAAFVAFGSYDTTTGVPGPLVSQTVNAKRTTIKIDKEASERDGVVEIGKDVTYTVKTNIPYIADNVEKVEYNITDTIEGAEYKVDDKGNFTVSVTIGGVNTLYTVEIQNNADGTQSFVLDLSTVAADRNNANAAVEISYTATVKSETVNNSVVPSDGKHEFTPAINTLYTGRITMTKTGENDAKLANAGFVIWRTTEDSKTVYALVSKDGDKNEYVLRGWTENLDEAKADANLIMTDSEGTAIVRGLDDSYTYNFKEIKAPEGYSVNQTDSVATWGENQEAAHRTGTAAMKDTKLNSLPSTGGMGTYLFTIIGVVVMAGAAGAFFMSRRRGSEE